MNIEIIEERLPIYWGPYLVNGDASGLENEEESDINYTLQKLISWHKCDCLDCVDMKEDVHFQEPPFHLQRTPLLAGDYATYVFYKI